MSELLDELKTKIATRRPETVYEDRPALVLDANARPLYDKLVEMYPDREIEVEHWTWMRVVGDHGTTLDVRRSIDE